MLPRSPAWILAFALVPALFRCAEPSGGPCEAVARAALRSGEPVPATSRQALTAGDVRLDRVEPDIVLPGTRIRVLGSYLEGEPGTTPEVRLEGGFTPSGGGARREVAISLTATAAEDGAGLEAVVSDGVLAAFGSTTGEFDGSLIVFTSVGDPPTPVEVSAFWRFSLAETLEPAIYAFNLGAEDVFPGDRVVVDGDGFLFPGEGSTLLMLTGEFAPEDGGAAYPITNTAVVEPAPDRRSGTVLVGPELIGPEPGSLRNGEVTLRSRTNAGIESTPPSPLPVSLRLNRPFVSGFDPPAPSRGQRFEVLGRGFLPDGQTLLRLDGTFTPDVPRGTTAEPLSFRDFLLTPDTWIDSGTVQMALLTVIEGDELTGISAAPGRFEGEVTPVLLHAGGEVVGHAWPGGFEIGPTRQMVWTKFLPTFADALDSLFGLKNVEDRVRQRALEVTARDYEGINIAFVEQRPEDFVEFSIIEVGGPDANHLGLFGLDNTEGKDTGNLRLNDIIGGANAGSGEQGYPVFGGVFIESFVGFSPQAAEPLPIASADFDRVLSPFAPFLCGEPVRAAELLGGARSGAIEEAIRVLGNIVGNTLVHEIGHSLGLTQSVAGKTAFHNIGDGDYIMDAGQDRSLAERAELAGAGPGKWHPANKEYLRRILPVSRPSEP